MSGIEKLNPFVETKRKEIAERAVKAIKDIGQQHFLNMEDERKCRDQE